MFPNDHDPDPWGKFLSILEKALKALLALLQILEHLKR